MVEQKRPEASLDRLRWYCAECKNAVHEATFHCTNLGTQIKEAVLAFEADEEIRRCKNCGTLATAAPPAAMENV